MEEQSFAKKDKLKSRKAIAELFTQSKSFGKNPLRIIWREESKSMPKNSLKILIAVPKKKVRKAVQRNRIKRLIREAYRQHKYEVINCLKKEGVELHLGILYVGGPIVTFDKIEQCLIELLKRFPSEYEKATK